MLDDGWFSDPHRWDAQPWVNYEDLHVVRRCNQCGRYVTEGKVFKRFDASLCFEGWVCKEHGEIVPFWVWREEEL